MKPTSIEQAEKEGWRKLSREEVRKLQKLYSSSELDTFSRGIDCNGKPDNTPCGGLGQVVGDSIVCYCQNGLCECFASPTFVMPPG